MSDGVEYHLAVGLDLSLTAPAACLVRGYSRGPTRRDSRIGEGIEVHDDIASFELGEKLRGPERLSRVTAALVSWLMSRAAWAPGILYVLEGYGFSGQQATSLGEFGGCVRRELWELGADMIVIPPSTLKRFVTGSGAGDKNVMMKWALKRWGFDDDDDNRNDAFCCAMVGLADLAEAENRTVVENDILGKKVLRYAGKGSTRWPGGAEVGKVAGGSRRRKGRRSDHGSSIL